jgi:hypothetical protein
MWDNHNLTTHQPVVSGFFREDRPLASGFESSNSILPTKEASSLQRLLAESAAEELTRQLNDSFHPAKIDLVSMISRGITVVSTMAAELGVVLRVKIRAGQASASVDEEKLRRVVNALVIHLLSVSQSGGWVTIGMEEQTADGRRGCLIKVTADNVVLPWKSNQEYEEELRTQAELSLCRKIMEKQGGVLEVRFQDDNKLAYSIWLPA